MKRHQKIITWVLAFSMMLAMCACSSKSDRKGPVKIDEESKPEHQGTTETTETEPGVTDAPTPVPAPSDSDIVDMTMFICSSGVKRDDDNEIKQLIAKKTGVRVKETWLNDVGIGQDEAIKKMIASGSLPDFIDAGTQVQDLYQQGLLVAWDEYLVKYPNLKAMYTDEEWEKFRADDGRIYWVNQYAPYVGKDMTTTYNGSAFWIQVRVLEAYGYPKIETLNQYFEILEKYAKEHPDMPDGKNVIPFTVLCDDWKYYCIEKNPLLLDGYADNGCAIVDVSDGADKPRVIDYNTTATAREYFRKLNEQYRKGNIDPDFGDQKWADYIEKLKTGRVLGLSDQYWDFAYELIGTYSTPQKAKDGKTYTLQGIGCEYVPLALVSSAGIKQHYYTSERTVNSAIGIAVTTSCENPDRAFKFLNDLLEQDVHDLRFWGVEGVDYLVDENGMYYRTEEMRNNWSQNSYKTKHICDYSYMPQLKGIGKDGKNSLMPAEQPSEYLATLSESVQRCFKAYGVSNFVEFVGSESVEAYPWYPLWPWSNNLDAKTNEGKAWKAMANTKQKWMKELVKAKKFDTSWDSYMKEYSNCIPQDFLAAAQREVDARVVEAKQNGWNP